MIAGCELDDESARALREQSDDNVIVGQRALVDSEATSDRHLGEGHGESTFAQVVTRQDAARQDRRMHPPVAIRSVGVGAGHGAVAWVVEPAEHRTEVAAAELGRCVADEYQLIAGGLQVWRDHGISVGYVGNGGDHEGGRHTVAFAVGSHILVVQRVLAADERRSMDDRGPADRFDGHHQFAERGRPARVAPREVVHERHPSRIGADGHDVPHGFVDHR